MRSRSAPLAAIWTARQTCPTCSSVMCGNIGSERTSRPACSATGNERVG